MRPTSIAFAAALMLGGMSTAYAQDGPGNDRERPGQAQEQQGQSRGDRGQAETKADRGGSAEKSESRASRSNGEDRSQSGSENKAAQGEQRGSDEQGQRSPRQAQEKSGSANENRASRKDDSDQASGKDQASDKKAQREDKSENRKAADRKDSDQDKTKSSQSRDDDDQKRAATQKDDDAKRAESGDRQRQGRDDAQRGDRKDGERDRKSARVELQGDRKEKVRNVFREHSGNVKKRTNVDIDISIGRSLPRDWDYYPVPASIIEVVPEYRGYRYVYVEDRYVIVEPDTYEVVTIIDAGGSGNTTTASRGDCPSDLTLSDEDREYLLKSVQIRNEVDVSGVSIGWRVPDTVELHTFPGPVTSRISGLSSCRYFVVDDRIAIVDPDEHNVVILVQD